jgi:hypothetical protein
LQTGKGGDKDKNDYDEVNVKQIKHNKKGLAQSWSPNFAGPIQIYWLALAGAVPANKELLTRAVPANKKLLAGTVPFNKELLAGTVPYFSLFIYMQTFWLENTNSFIFNLFL